MGKDYEFTPPPNWPPPPRGWTPPPGWTPDPQWGPAPEGWEFWTTPESGPGTWFAQHTVLTGVGATAIVLGSVIGITTLANGSGKTPAAAVTTSSTQLTATDQGTTDDSATTPDQTLSSTTSQPPASSTTSTTRSPSSGTGTTTSSSPSPTTSSPSPSPTRTVRVYPNCRAMNRDHPHGVGLPGATDRPQVGQKPVRNFDRNARLYLANQGLDLDGDQIACER